MFLFLLAQQIQTIHFPPFFISYFWTHCSFLDIFSWAASDAGLLSYANVFDSWN